MTASVRLEREGHVGWLVFDNEPRRNALTAEMLDGTVDALAEAAKDDDVRVIVLRGAGDKAFVSGADISAFGSETGVDRSRTGPVEVIESIARLDKPVIAALKGWCLGAGVLVALAADLRVAGDDVRMGIPAAKLGVAYPREGVDRITALAGPAIASELLMTGEPYDAAAALRVGLVNRVVAAADVFAAATEVATTIAANAPLTLRASKLAIAGAPEVDEAIRACFTSDDFQEGQRAFAEKRPPRFNGR